MPWLYIRCLRVYALQKLIDMSCGKISDGLLPVDDDENNNNIYLTMHPIVPESNEDVEEEPDYIEFDPAEHNHLFQDFFRLTLQCIYFFK